MTFYRMLYMVHIAKGFSKCGIIYPLSNFITNFISITTTILFHMKVQIKNDNKEIKREGTINDEIDSHLFRSVL